MRQATEILRAGGEPADLLDVLDIPIDRAGFNAINVLELDIIWYLAGSGQKLQLDDGV